VIRYALKSLGLAAPGLPGWNAAVPVLAGRAAYLPADEPPFASTLLPPNERRRATAAVRQAFRAAEDAMGASVDPRALASVFASSDADLVVLHRICSALAEPTRAISPIDFHNSVHNAASGYWSIAVQSMAPTTTVAAYDASFTAGLLEATALATDLGTDVLLVAYDAIAPAPLLAKRPLAASASVALVLGRADAPSLGTLTIEMAGGSETPCALPALESLRTGNPAMRALPLLELVAARRAGTVTLLGTGDVRVAVGYSP
jgi:hypothetical protein